MLLEIVLLILSLVAAFYVYSLHKYGYWKRKGVPHADCVFPFGSVKGLNKEHNLGGILKKNYFESKGLPYYGINIFSSPGILIKDPQLIKEVLIKEFSSFHDRGFYINTDKDPLTDSLFFTSGQRWKNMRVKMSPTFTSGKMKMMFPTMMLSAQEMLDYLEKPAETGEILDIKDVFAKFTINVIARVAFGLELDSYKNPVTDFTTLGSFLTKPSFIQAIRTTIFFGFSKWSQNWPITLIPAEVNKFFIDVVTDTIKYRDENKVERNDFMQLLITLKNKGRVETGKGVDAAEASELAAGTQGVSSAATQKPATLEEVAAQAFTFFVAGYETASTALQFTLFELALNPSIQTKLQKEIDAAVGKNAELTYEAIMQMTYLEQVIEESLRKYPATPFLFREATKNFKVADSDLVIEEGTRVVISILGLHNDPEYFPNPETFDPDRFSPENKPNIRPNVYVPFGDGPRLCIGMRFAMMQMKIGLCQFLTKYSVHITEKTPTPPVRFNPKVIITALLGTMYLKVSKRNINT